MSEDFRTMESEARYFVRLFVTRQEKNLATKGTRRWALLQAGCEMSAAPTTDKTVPSDLECWIATVGCILRDLGPKQAAVLMLRAGATDPKSGSVSYDKIASKTGIDDKRECRSVYETAVVRFVDEVHRRQLTDEYRSPLAFN